jgi:hypothetical protein
VVGRAHLGFVVKGLEAVAAGELVDLVPAAEVLEERPKLLRFSVPPSSRRLARLRCFDDVALQVGGPFDAATPERFDDALGGEAFADVLRSALAELEAARPLGGAFSVTGPGRSPIGPADAVGPRLAEIIARASGLVYSPGERAPVDVRLFADGSYMVVGLRLFEHPLGRRTYRVANRQGGLRPTVAAALVRLAAGPETSRVWDPFCGSGTILCEAVVRGLRVAGSDVEPDAVRATIENLRAVGGPLVAESVHDVVVRDALKATRWTAATRSEALVTNLPWGKQVPVARRTAFFRALGSRIATYAGVHSFAILTTDPDVIVRETRRAGMKIRPQVRRLGLVGQTPSIVFVPGGRGDD